MNQQVCNQLITSFNHTTRPQEQHNQLTMATSITMRKKIKHTADQGREHGFVSL